MVKRQAPLVEAVQGQHIALSVATHLARTKLAPGVSRRYDTEHFLEMLDVLARALAKTAPLYVREGADSDPRELRPDELEGLTVEKGGNLVLLQDGRKLSSVSIKRSDLRDAIAILISIGVPGISQPRIEKPATHEPPPLDPQVALEELERLLRPPFISPEIEEVNRILIGLARQSKIAGLASTAMSLMTALNECRGRNVLSENARALLGELRAALPKSERARANT